MLHLFCNLMAIYCEMQLLQEVFGEDTSVQMHQIRLNGGGGVAERKTTTGKAMVAFLWHFLYSAESGLHGAHGVLFYK